MQTKLKVTLIAYTPDAEKLVAAAAKLCYAKSDVDTLMDNLTAEKVEDFIERLAELGHQSPIELRRRGRITGTAGTADAAQDSVVLGAIAAVCR